MAESYLSGEAVTARGVCWSTLANPTIADSKTEDGTGTGSFSSSLNGLTPDTTYYLRSYATNAAGTFYGDEQTFATSKTGVDLYIPWHFRNAFSVQIDAYFPINLLESITTSGLCWSTSVHPTISDNKIENDMGTDYFSTTLTGLTPGTTYYLRSYVTNAMGTFYEDEQTFVTRKMTMNLSVKINNSLHVQIDAYFPYHFEESIVTSGVCWSTSANPTIADNKIENNMGIDGFSTTTSEFSTDTTYYLRSYTTTEMDTYYSNDVVFSRPLHGGILTGPDSNDFFNTQEDYESALVDAYHMLRVTFWNVLSATIASDDVIAGGDPSRYDQPTLQRIDKMDQTPTDNNYISDIWGFMYEAMDKANYILEFQDKTAFEGKQEVIAQAYFLRAYFAFELTKFFGDIPLLLNEAGTRIQNKRIHTADPFAVNREGSKAKVYELIEADLVQAIGLGLPTSLTNPNEKYITEHAAQALLGKVYLYHGSDDASKFSKAATELNKVIESSKYSLVSAYDNIFSNDNENNVESVFEIQYVSTEGASWSCLECNKGNYVPKYYAPRSPYNGPVYISGWGLGLPTQQLYDSYSNGDTRRDATLFKPNENYSPSRENTGYFIKKYLPTKANDATRAGSDPLNYENNYRAIRYADVLLMAAEAEAQSSGANAITYLNMVRERAFGDNSHDFPYNGENDLLEAIYKERRLELATEGHRYFDLVRTGKAEEAYEAYNAAISGNGDFEIITFETNKNEVFPIPSMELGLSNAVDRWGQNPGYSVNDSGGDNGDATDPVGTTITGVDFAIAELNGDGNEVGVTPTSTGGTLYSVDFGDPAAANDEDVFATSGPQVSYTYSKESATYTITATASASNASDVVVTKNHSVTIEITIENNGGGGANDTTTLVDFEANPAAVGFALESEFLTVTTEDASDNANGNGKVGRIVCEEEGDGWKSTDLVLAKNLDLAENSTITMDFYNAEAVSVPVVLKLSGVVYPDTEGADKMDCQVMTSAVAGWQKLTFDFETGYASGDSNMKPLVFDGPQWGAVNIFIGVTMATGANTAGTYEIDNLAGAGWGDVKDTTDTDGDGIIDSTDSCPDVAAEEGKDADKDGCTDPDTLKSSNASDDFEGNGNLFWLPDGGTTYDDELANPFIGTGNTSATVLKYNDNGDQYANINFNLSDGNSVKFDLTSKHVFTVNVYVPTPAEAVTENKQLSLKLQDGSSSTPWEGQTEVIQPYEYDQWQTLTFDFSEVADETKYSRIVVQFNGENNYEVVEGYIDDILLK